jgi:hypothetical protein
LHPAVPKPDVPQSLEVYLGPSSSWFFQTNPEKTQLCLDSALGPHPVPDELPAPTDDLAVVKFLLTGHPYPLQHPLGQQMGQFTAVPPIGLDPVAVLLGNQTRRSNYARDAMLHQAVMKPEPKISGFIDRLQLMPSVSSQYTLERLPVPWNAGAEQLQVHCPNGYVPPDFMQVDSDK